MTSTNSESIYTATENCYALVTLQAHNGYGGFVYINGLESGKLFISSGTGANTFRIVTTERYLLHKDDVIKVVGNTLYVAQYIVYGIKYSWYFNKAQKRKNASLPNCIRTNISRKLSLPDNDHAHEHDIY